jgi:ribosome-associated protein
MQINPNLFGISLDLLYLCAQILDNLLMIQLVETIKEAIQDKKGSNIVVADLTKIEGTICQYFIICTGNSPTQVEAIAESIGDVVREKLGEKPAHVVGLENAQWVAMDYTDVLVHVFLPDVRDYYDLEHLWEDAPLTRIPDLD